MGQFIFGIALIVVGITLRVIAAPSSYEGKKKPALTV
jgi:hypothetical protein